jgi:hypothetical protein
MGNEGETGPDDQVPRLKAFLAAYPEWVIRIDRSTGFWRAERNGQAVTRYELRDLLDALGAPGYV